MVHVGAEDESTGVPDTDNIEFTIITTGNSDEASDGTEVEITGVPVQRMSAVVQQLMDSCIRKQTRSKYQSIQKAWKSYCARLGLDPMKQETYVFLNFLAEGYERNLKWGTLRSYVPALHKYMKYVDIFQVRRLLKGVFNLRPPVARYTRVWDVNLVLHYLCAMETQTFMDLTMKLATLLMILSGNRVNMLTHFDVIHLTLTPEECTFTFGHVLKTTRPNFNTKPMTFRAYPHCPQLCPVSTVWQYLEVRNTLTDDTQFFISTKPNRGIHKGVSSDTIARWVKDMLGLSGIDSGKYTAHSCRAASTSSALFRGISLKTIIQSASWSNVSTFKKHYFKEITSVYKLDDTNFGEEMLNRYVESTVE